ncbi:MAG: hypothetical protein MRZ45_11095 [Blautia sp.]|nr:hypothetical protein [Blautia sp.]MDY4516523.1 hypothetical protein [Lachnospiraceae bacterium]
MKKCERLWLMPGNEAYDYKSAIVYWMKSKLRLNLAENHKRENGGRKMPDIFIIIYLVLGYWATGQTIYRNRILIGTGNGIFLHRVIMGALLGWILIPWAIIVCITQNR